LAEIPDLSVHPYFSIRNMTDANNTKLTLTLDVI